MKSAILSNLPPSSLAIAIAELPPIWTLTDSGEAAEVDRYAAGFAEDLRRLLPYTAEGAPLVVLCEDPHHAPAPAPSPGLEIYRARTRRTGSALLEARTAEAKEAEAIVVAQLGKWINREIYAEGGDGGADCGERRWRLRAQRSCCGGEYDQRDERASGETIAWCIHKVGAVKRARSPHGAVTEGTGSRSRFRR